MKSAIVAIVLCLAALANAQTPTSWRSVGPGGGGALFAPSWHPTNAGEIFMACDMSELFHTTDTAVTWNPAPFTHFQAGGASPKVQFTSNPLLMYSIDYTNEVATPVVSTNGGADWSALPGDPTGADAWSIVADFNNPNRVLVGDYSRLFALTNGGASFVLRYTAISSGAGLNVGGAFFDSNTIVLGTNDGLLVSTNGGTNFAINAVSGIPSTEAIVSFAGAKVGGTTRFFCVTLGSADVYNGVRGDSHADYRNVYSLDFGAGSWTARGAAIPAGHEPFFVDMAGNNINIAYVAGGSSGGVPIVDKTTNGGASWQSVLLTTNNQNVATGWQGAGGDRDWSYGELIFGFDVHPTDANRAAFTDYGFIHLTTDGGASWRQGYVSPASQNPAGANTPRGRSYTGNGLEDTSCWSLAWANTNTMWGSYSDIKGTRSLDGGNTWGFNFSGHNANSSYRVVVHPTTHVMYMATSTVHDMYQSTHLTDSSIDGGTGNVLFSGDNGLTWQTLGSIGKTVMSVSLDPVNTNRIYATVANSATGGVYVSNNISAGTSATWTHLPNPPRTQGHAFNVTVLNDATVLTTFSGRRAGSPVNFTASSGVFYSTNGGSNWTDCSTNQMLYWTKDVVVDPNDAGQNTWYACVFSGYGGPANDLGGLYRTTNRGGNWKQISNLSHVESCAVDPQHAGQLYFTTEQNGLWFTPDATTNAPSFSLVTSYPFRQPERVFFSPVHPGEIWVTSFGHGIRVGNVSTSGHGDCDGSGAFGPADIPCFVALLLGTSNDPAAIARSDFNGDGHVDGADIAGLVGCAISGCP